MMSARTMMPITIRNPRFVFTGVCGDAAEVLFSWVVCSSGIVA